MVEKSFTKEAELRTELFLKQVSEDVPRSERRLGADEELRSHVYELALAKADAEGARQVELAHVERAIHDLGPLADVAKTFHGDPGARNAPEAPKRFYRTTLTDKKIAGVCGGVARYLGWDPLLVRVLWIVGTLVSMGAGILAYVILWVAAPSEEKARSGGFAGRGATGPTRGGSVL